MTTSNVATLWSQYLAGNREAIGGIYQAMHGRLLLFCLSKLRDTAKAEDAASETLNKLLVTEKPEEIRNVEQWLFTVAKNHCLSLLTKEQRHREIEGRIKPLFRTSTAHEGEQKLAAENLLQMRQKALSEKEHNVWRLHEQGYQNAEISTQLAMSEKTVANHKSNARNKLRQLLKSIST